MAKTGFLIYFCSVIIISLSLQQDPGDYPEERIPGACLKGLYDCKQTDPVLCLPFSSVRNCVFDCKDGSDEDCPPEQPLCDDKLPGKSGCGKCVKNVHIYSHCRDRHFNKLCQMDNIFNCTTTLNCVFNDMRFNGDNDCEDWSDENICLDNSKYPCDANAECIFTALSSLEFKQDCACKPGYNGDGKSGAGFTGCTPVPSTTSTSTSTKEILQRIPGEDGCPVEPLSFDCGGGTCIPLTKFWDCTNDCPNGMDEACWTGQVKCPGSCRCYDPNDTRMTCDTKDTDCNSQGMFQCLIGGCVPDSKVSDGTEDCVDGSDENYCQNLIACPPGSGCVYNPQNHKFACSCPENTVADNNMFCQQQAVGVNDLPTDCTEIWKKNNAATTGMSQIYAKPGKPPMDCATADACRKDTWCVQSDDIGHGWTVIQRRKTKSQSFNQNWDTYKQGFGNPESGDYWIGNEFLNQITTQENTTKTYGLLVIGKTKSGQEVRAGYNYFAVGPAEQGYILLLGRLSEGNSQ